MEAEDQTDAGPFSTGHTGNTPVGAPTFTEPVDDPAAPGDGTVDGGEFDAPEPRPFQDGITGDQGEWHPAALKASGADTDDDGEDEDA